jgi:hypothetical protein
MLRLKSGDPCWTSWLANGKRAQGIAERMAGLHLCCASSLVIRAGHLELARQWKMSSRQCGENGWVRALGIQKNARALHHRILIERLPSNVWHRSTSQTGCVRLQHVKGFPEEKTFYLGHNNDRCFS